MSSDEIFGEIILTKEEKAIEQTPELNRIKKIKQLGLSYLVPQFSSAQHSRYDHSLGVLYLANKIGETLSLGPKQIQALRIAALLHDIGHGPFSHFSEKILDILGTKSKHEEISADKVINSPDLSKIWNKYKNLPDRNLIANIISNKSQDKIIGKIIVNDIDADRIDYLLRDMKHTQLGYTRDYERLIQGLTNELPTKRPDIAIKEEYVTDANFLLLARVMLRSHVYYESRHRSIEILIFECLKRAISDGTNSEFFHVTNDDLKKKLFYNMDDGYLLYELEKASIQNEKTITEIKNGKIYDSFLQLKWRQLSPYLQDEIREKENQSLKALYELSDKIRNELSTSLCIPRISANEIFVDIPKLGRFEEASMKVLTSDGRLERLDNFSPLAKSLKESYLDTWSLLIFLRSNDGTLNINEFKNNIITFFIEW